MEKENALQKVSNSIGMNVAEMKSTLMSTVIKDIKVGEKYRKATEAEFMAVIAVAATYGLNPLTKEIYAYPDKGGIVPIVSTDGWNKLMTTHPNYLSHSYLYSETMVTPAGGKTCYDWIEIIITKKDGSELRLREYLDECYRKPSYPSPWQTHTKRMLRHKVKIQGAREAFGFGGIYEQDEGQRIIEADVTPLSKTASVQPMGTLPTSESEAPVPGWDKKTAEQEKLFAVLVEYCKGDEDKMKEVLMEVTSFTNNKDKIVAGKESVYDVSEKACPVARHKIEEMAKKPAPESKSGDCPDCEWMAGCELTRKKGEDCDKFEAKAE